MQLSERLREKFGRRVVGPVSPPIDRLRGEYIIHLMIKIENGRSMARARELLGEAMRGISSRSEYKTVKILIDVDAQ